MLDLSYLDILSFKPKLKTGGRSRFKTNYGIFFSIITLIAIIAVSIILILQVLLKQQLTSIFNQDSITFPKVNLTEQPLIVYFTDNNDQLKSMPASIASIEVKYVTKQIIYNNKTIPLNNVTVTDILFTNCSNDVNVMKSEGLQKLTKLPGTFCIPTFNNNLTIFGKQSNIVAGFSELQVIINKCNNYSNNIIKCASEDDIQNTLSNTKIALTKYDNNIDLTNYLEPISEFSFNTKLQISAKVRNDYSLIIKQVNIYTDDGLIFPSSDLVTSNQIDSIERYSDLISNKEDSIIASISLVCSNKIDIYNRHYPKIQEVMANIGGFTKFILLIMELVVGYLSNNDFITRQINNLFIIQESLPEQDGEAEAEEQKQNKKVHLSKDKNLISRCNNNIYETANIKSSTTIFKVNGNNNHINNNLKYIRTNMLNTNKQKNNNYENKKLNFRLSFCEIICFSKCFKNRLNLTNFKEAKAMVDQYLSVEHITLKLLEINKIKQILLSSNNEMNLKNIIINSSNSNKNNNLKINKHKKSLIKIFEQKQTLKEQKEALKILNL